MFEQGQVSKLEAKGPDGQPFVGVMPRSGRGWVGSRRGRWRRWHRYRRLALSRWVLLWCGPIIGCRRRTSFSRSVSLRGWIAYGCVFCGV